MKNFFTTKRLCRAGVIAALYVALTYAFAPLAFGPFQIRPAEALCILPVFFPEAIPALYIGCMLSNLASPYFVYDVLIGSLATLFAAFSAYMVGRFIKKEPYRFILCGLPTVLFNAFLIAALMNPLSSLPTISDMMSSPVDSSIFSSDTREEYSFIVKSFN